MQDALPLKPDGRQSEKALQIQRGTSRYLRSLGYAVMPEFALASSRRADLFAVKGDGTIWIIEIKSSLQDFRSDQKWHEYRDYCDYFSFAIPTDLSPEIMPQDAGLIVADQYGADELRAALPHPLHAARRKAVTLSFARNAAARLHSLWDP